MIKVNLKVLNDKIQIYDDNIEMLTRISWKNDLNNYTPIDRINTKVSLFYDNYIQTKKEVEGRLTYSEALFLILTIEYLGNAIGCYSDNRKELIEALDHFKNNSGRGLIEDGKLTCISDKEQQKFSMDLFIEKIKEMTQFQCFTVISIAYEVIIIMNRGNIVNFISDKATKIIREAFGIE